MSEPIHDPGIVWIRTEPSVDGTTYVVTVEFTDDRAITLTQGGAMRYVMELLTAVEYAEHDAAVLRQMSGLVDFQAGALLVKDLRKDRAPIDGKATRPLRFEPGVSQQRMVGFLTLRLDDEPIGQWDLGAARRHALGVLQAVIAADLDAAYLRELMGVVGLDESAARQAVGDISNHRQDEHLRA